MTGATDVPTQSREEEVFVPRPVETKKVPIPHDVHSSLEKFAEHYHDIWCSQMVRNHPEIFVYMYLRNCNWILFMMLMFCSWLTVGSMVRTMMKMKDFIQVYLNLTISELK